MINRDNRASFEMDCLHRIVTDDKTMSCTMEYECVMGEGKIEIVTDDEKYDALCEIMKHYHKEDFHFNKNIIPMTNVFKMVVKNITGKRRMKK